MKKNLNDPKLYDRVFYPKIKPVFFLVSVFLAVICLFFDAPLSFFGGIAVIHLLFLWFYSKRLSAGISRDGLYVRGYGMISWNKIKEFDTKAVFWWPGWFMASFWGAAQQAIIVSLVDPKKDIKIIENDISIKAKEFIKILEEYRQRFS